MPSYTYNSSSELTSTSNATYTYDANGNPQTKADSSGTTTYDWDFENRLTSVVLPGTGGTVSFKYDPFGRRIQKGSSTGTTSYLYDGTNSVEEVDASGTVLARYAQGAGIDEPLAEVRSGILQLYQQDGYVSNNLSVLIDPLGMGAKGAAIGAAIGGTIGGVGGGVVGGTGGAATGAAGCTLVAPGVGTVGCGVVGGAVGATAGAVGTVIGDTVEDVIDGFKQPKKACNQKEKEKDDRACYAVYLADTAYCGEHFTNDTEYEAAWRVRG
jgi:YD repeat-containing protein